MLDFKSKLKGELPNHTFPIYNDKGLNTEYCTPDYDPDRDILNFSGNWEYYMEDVHKTVNDMRSPMWYLDFGRGYYVNKKDVVNWLTRAGLWELSESTAREVLKERRRQQDKWGTQNWPILSNFLPRLTRVRYLVTDAEAQKKWVEKLMQNETCTYMDILLEEVLEAIEAPSPEELREELIQVAAVAMAMVESLDRNGK